LIVITAPAGRSATACAVVGLFVPVDVRVPVAPAPTRWSAALKPVCGAFEPPVSSIRSVMPVCGARLVFPGCPQIPTSIAPGRVVVIDGAAALVPAALLEASMGVVVSTPE
jgi:hypothetical protein